MALIDMKRASENFWDRLDRFLRWRSRHRKRLKYDIYRETFKKNLRKFADEKRKGGVLLKMKFFLILEAILTAYTVYFFFFGGKWGFGKVMFFVFYLAGIVTLAYCYLSSRMSLEGIYNEASAEAYAAQYEELEAERRRFDQRDSAPEDPTDQSDQSDPPDDPAPESPAPTEADFQAMLRNLGQLATNTSQRRSRS